MNILTRAEHKDVSIRHVDVNLHDGGEGGVHIVGSRRVHVENLHWELAARDVKDGGTVCIH